ncbi:carbohydrate ABC transporter permease [Kroppenstedtia sanguinis]|uniref:Carbohydrate ABC transporter permease n=1 Tax=Kroppenstedtia sanguinis TaxID=1380684 RepID=A0ABW4CEI9_9BACL
MKKGTRKGLSEGRLAWLLVIPALLLILVIAIFPVFRSFWLSLHDVRLNDATKRTTHSSYGIDLEGYANSMPFLLTALDQEIGQAKGEGKERLTSIQERVKSVQSSLEGNPQIHENFKKVDDLLFEGQSVPENLSRVELDKKQAQTTEKQVTQIRSDLKAMEREGLLHQPKRVTGLANGLQKCLIEPNFVGLKYYRIYLTDERMWASLANTFIFTGISVAVELVLGIAVALLINRQFVGRGLVRASVLIPWALPTAVAALMWKFLFDGQNGVMAKIFAEIGLIPDMGTLLTTKFWSMFAVIFADVWKATPFMALLILAGLQAIPKSLYEAAQVDGASRIQQFFKITLPMLRTTILVALLFRVLDAFRVFDLIYVLTGGGPANATETISVYAYKTMFAQMNFGAGSALAVIVFICIAIISVLFVKLLGRDLISDGSGK